MELAPDGIADATLQGAQRLLLRLPLGDLALVVGLARGVVADLGDGGQVEGMVQFALPRGLSRWRLWGPLEASMGAVPL